MQCYLHTSLTLYYQFRRSFVQCYNIRYIPSRRPNLLQGFLIFFFYFVDSTNFCHLPEKAILFCMAFMNQNVDATGKFQTGLDDSGIDVKPFEGTDLSERSTVEKSNGEDRPEYKAGPKEDHSDVLGEISLNLKKLNDAETQLKSLTLILGQASSRKPAGLDLTTLEKNKEALEGRVQKLKRCISKKELELASSLKAKLPEEFSEMIQQDERANDHSLTYCFNGLENEQVSCKRICQDDQVLSLSCAERSELTSKVVDWLDGSEWSERSESSLEDLGIVVSDENNFTEHLRKENIRLRRKLSEARKKNKDERNQVIEQLRILEKEALNGEKNWMNKVQVKQLRIEELVNKSEELKTRNKKLMVDLEGKEELRKKELTESERQIKQKNEIISDLKTKAAKAETNEEKLEEDLKNVQRILDETESTTKNLTERQNELEYELSNKNKTVEETYKELENRSEEIKQMRADMVSLRNAIITLTEDKRNLNELLKTSRNGNENQEAKVAEFGVEKRSLKEKCFVEVSLQTTEESLSVDELSKTKLDLESEIKINKELKQQLSEARNCVNCFEENEVQNKGKMAALEQKLFHKERWVRNYRTSAA